MVALNWYRAFGLIIASDISSDVWEFWPDQTQNPDVRISLSSGPATELSGLQPDGHYWLGVPEVALFDIADGASVVVYPPAEPDWGMIGLFLTGSVLSTVLTQRGVYAFHGSAFVQNGEAVLISGDSGAGKSTTATALWQRGYKLLSDDVCAISFDEQTGRAWIQPAYPTIKLWRQALEVFDIDTTGLTQVSQRLDKFYVPLGESFEPEAKPVSRVIFLSPSSDCDSVSMRKLSGMELFQQMHTQAHRLGIIQELGLQGQAFNWVSQFSKYVKGYEIARPREMAAGVGIGEVLGCLAL